MRSVLTSIAASSLLAALAIAADPPRYTMKDLGNVGDAGACVHTAAIDAHVQAPRPYAQPRTV
jgi:hypothetical protein